MSNIMILTCVVIFSLSISQATVYEDYFKEKENKRATLYISPDEYCQRTYSNSSYLCRDNDNYRTNYEGICSTLYCYDAIYIKSCVFSIPPQDSTLCGNGKWCETQSCQDNANALSSSDSCPLGDTAKQDVALNMNCKQIVAKRPSMCYDDKVGRLWCCGSCGAIVKPDPANFTGPAVSANHDCQSVYGPSSYFCQGTQFYKNQDFSNVCTNMFCFNPGTGTCQSIPAVDGVPCAPGKWCVGAQCIASSLAPVNPMTECFYGNQYQTFCQTNVVYPNVATYCSQYESGCCDICASYKNTSLPSGCQYGDMHPDICSKKVKDNTIKAYCESNEADCCQTCVELKNKANSACPYGDFDVGKCKKLMNDSIGPGNCYSLSKRTQCCDTCTEYYNASKTGCEYGDHWKDYCAANVVPPNVADVCSRYASQCCGICKEYEEKGHAGCRYGDRDPVACQALMDSNLGTANCYNIVHQTQCCATCEKIKDSTTPGCVYGDNAPSSCVTKFNDSRGAGNCYDLQTQIDCCRSCAQARNTSRPAGCQYGDNNPTFCEANIQGKSSAFLCFSYEAQCCETCAKYKVSDNQDCRYGDKDPIKCQFQIPDEPAALTRCPTLGLQCCETCSRHGHPGPGGKIYSDSLVG